MSTKDLQLDMSIPCSSEFVSVVRLAVAGVATRMNFNIEDIEDIKISVSEACTNAIQHAYNTNENQEQNKIDIRMNMNTETLKIIVTDYGKGFDTSTLGTKEQKERSKQKLGLGLGLTFIENLMDETELKSEIGQGTTVTMLKQVTSVTTPELA